MKQRHFASFLIPENLYGEIPHRGGQAYDSAEGAQAGNEIEQIRPTPKHISNNDSLNDCLLLNYPNVNF